MGCIAWSEQDSKIKSKTEKLNKSKTKKLKTIIKRKNYKFVKTKTMHTIRWGPHPLQYAGLVLQRKYGGIMLLICKSRGESV